MSLLYTIGLKIWGPQLSSSQMRLYSIFATIFFTLMFGYWMIRPMKMGIFIAVVGLEEEPRAKLGTVIVLIPLLMGYNRLVSSAKSIRNLAMLVMFCYVVIFGIITLSCVASGQLSTSMSTPEGIGEATGKDVKWHSPQSITFPSSPVTQAMSTAAVYAGHQLGNIVTSARRILGDDNSPVKNGEGPPKVVQKKSKSKYAATKKDSGYEWLGWTVYWTVETYGSVVVAMCWSIIADICGKQPGVAASVYPVMVIVCQIGAVLGASMSKMIRVFGFTYLFAFQTAMVVALALMLLEVFREHASIQASAGQPASSTSSSNNADDEEEVVKLLENNLNNDLKNSQGERMYVSEKDVEMEDLNKIQKHRDNGNRDGKHSSEKKLDAPTGILEGLRLIIMHPYVGGIAVVSSFNEIVTTVMDFNMKVMARSSISDPKEFSHFMGTFGQVSNIVSLIMAIVGTKFLIARLGLRLSLMAFPVGCLVLILVMYLWQTLWVAFAANVLLKALKFSLNNPAKELLYVQTSKDIKFKAKSWVDMFGTRGAKALGSIVNEIVTWYPKYLVEMGSAMEAGFVIIWVWVAHKVGGMNKAMVDRGESIQ